MRGGITLVNYSKNLFLPEALAESGMFHLGERICRPQDSDRDMSARAPTGTGLHKLAAVDIKVDLGCRSSCRRLMKP